MSYKNLSRQIAQAAYSENLSVIAVMFNESGFIKPMGVLPDNSRLSFKDVENIAADFEKITRKALDRRGGIRPIKDNAPE